MIDVINRLLAPLQNRVTNMIARAVVKVVSDDKKMQLVQISVLADEIKDDVERVQNFGFTSNPKDGAEAVIAFVGGCRGHGVVIAVDDRRYRICNLEPGEVAVYDATGSKIVLKKNGDIEATPSSGKLKIVGDLHVTGDTSVDGDAKVSGDTNCDGTVTGTTDCVGGGKSLKSHMHSVSATDSGTSGGAVTFVPSGSTGAPS